MGSPTAVTARRDVRLLMKLATAEAASAGRVLLDRAAQVALSEVGPERVDEDKLRVGSLPEQEVRHAQLPGRTDEEIGVRHLRSVEPRRDGVLVDVPRVDPVLDEAAGRIDELG